MTDAQSDPDEDVLATLSKADLIPDAALKSKDDDKFGHTEIASIVANLTAYVEMPVNVALFGPWGSGKSSLFSLIEGELKERRAADAGFPVVKAIRYDAWKFSGTPLKRNFISNAAKELGLDKTRYRTDLYENRSALQLSFKQLLTQPMELIRLVAAVAGVLAVGVVLLSAVWALGSMIPEPGWSTDKYWDFAKEHFRDSAKWAVISLIPLVGSLRLLDFAKVTVTRSAPTEDEEFHDAFNDLMQHAINQTDTRFEARRKKIKKQPARESWNRVLVFVDELDRCAPDDVLQTLIGIKTFLEHDKCVFVVAADRDVLVEALEKGEGDRSRQATPVRQHEPYYSTAGAFLDKMFQYQLELPTLRRHKLTVFAKEVVEAHGEGIWSEFGEEQLEDVIYTLIPLHVRSPRRVKVLLNAFATTARIADARGVTWRTQPARLAKLTVLRTEFPRFAHDLQLEPRLVKALEDREPPGEESTQRMRDLYDTYTLGTELAPYEEDDEPQALSASPIIGASTAESDVDALRQAQVTINEHLLDYLEKTKYARITGPTRELLHLESAGQKEGLEDETLADAIDDAPDRDPGRTLEAFEGASPGDRAIAARIIGAEVDQQVGPGKQSVVETVCRLVEGLGPEDTRSVAASIAPAITRAVGTGLGTSAMIPGALALGAARGDAGALEPVLDRFSTLVREGDDLGNTRLIAVADMIPRLSAPDATRVAAIITDSLSAGLDRGVVRFLEIASDDLLDCYWTDHATAIVDALVRRISAAASAGEPLEPPAVFDAVLVPLVGRTEPRWDLVTDWLLRVLQSDNEYYRYVFERTEEHLPNAGREAAQNKLAFAALAIAAPSNWQFWLYLLDESTADETQVEAALVNLVEKVDLASADEIALLKSASDRLVALLETPTSIGSLVYLAVAARAPEITWDETSRRTYRAWDSLLGHFDPAIESDHDDLIAAEIMRAVTQTMTPQAVNDLIAYILEDSSDGAATKLLVLLRTTYTSHDADTFRAFSAAQVRCNDITPIPMAAFDRLRTIPSVIDEAWLDSMPPMAEVVAQYTKGISLDENAVARYAARLSQSDRTALWLELEAQSLATALLKKVAAPGVEWTQVSSIFNDAVNGSSDAVRKAAIERLDTLPLHDDALIEETTNLVEALLTSGTKSNYVLAATVALAAGRAQSGRIRVIKGLFNDIADDLTDSKLLALSKIGLATRPEPKPKGIKALGKALFGK